MNDWRTELAMILQRAAATNGLSEYPAAAIRARELLDRALADPFNASHIAHCQEEWERTRKEAVITALCGELSQ